MKKTILTLFISLLLTHAVDAKTEPQSQDKRQDKLCREMTNFYAQVFGGANFLPSTNITGTKASYNAGYIFSGALGYAWRYGLHVEGEYAFRKNGISHIRFVSQGTSNQGEFFTSSYMANLLWYMPLSSWGCKCWNIRPLIGTGLGYDFQQMHASNSRVAFYQKWHNFSWQLMAGLAVPIFRNAELSLEYKFHQGGSHFYNNAIGLGFLYKFGYLR